jgi:sugar transferase (PEP-CTERM/EpsH1 system associated)
MQILFIVPYVPNPVHVRSFNLIKWLSGRGHQITLATLWTAKEEQKDLQRLAPYCQKILAFPLTKWRSYLNSFLALASPDPLQSAYCWNSKLANGLGSLVKNKDCQAQFDIIHIEHLRGARYGTSLEGSWNCKTGVRREKTAPPIVWDSVDNISLLFQQASVHSSRFFSRLMTRFELSRTKGYEARLMQQFSTILVTSQNDRKAFLDLQPGTRNLPDISVIPNGVDTQFFSPDPTLQREPDTLVISGKMSYHANVTMCLNFVSQVMPMIWANRPGVKLWLVGKDPTEELKALGKNPAITVTGTVADIRPYLLRSTLAVAPLTYGVGIQNKVLEAMACGTPVVSTPQAVSALSTVTGRDVAVANSPQELASTILQLLDDPDRCARLGLNGRKYVEKNHCWDEITAHLEEVYYGVI